MLTSSFSRSTRALPTAWLLGLPVLLSSACTIVHGSGNVIEEERKVAAFNRISIEGEGTVHFTQTKSQDLVVEAEDNLLDDLTTVVRNGRLILGTRVGKLLDPTKPIIFNIDAPDLEALEVSGSGDFLAEDLETSDLTIDVSGSGKVTLGDLEAGSLASKISGSGSIQLGGNVTDQEVAVSGSGDYRAKDLESATGRVDVSGSGDVSIFATGSLDVKISGSGKVSVHGSPRLTSDVSGSGKIDSI